MVKVIIDSAVLSCDTFVAVTCNLASHDFHTQHSFASQSVRKANVCYNYKKFILNMYYKPSG